MKTIGIVGSRRRNGYTDKVAVAIALSAVFQEGDWIVSGGCPRGGDRFAEELARALGATILIYHANWTKKGRGAGFARNTDIAITADILIACVASDRTGGTEDTIRKFEKRGLKAILV